MAPIPIIDQGPISTLGFAHNWRQTFYGSQKEHETQKVAKAKGPEKTKWKGQQRKIWNGIRQKMSRFWLMRKHQVKIFYIFVPNLEEIYLSG